MDISHNFRVLIVSVCVTFIFLAVQSNAINLSLAHNGLPCPNAIPTTTDKLKCAVAEPYAGNFALHCKSDSPLPSDLTLAWTKNNVVVQSNDRIKIYGSDELVLNFTSVIPDDHDDYQCRAVKKGEEVNKIAPENIGVQVRVLPYVKNARKDITVVEQNFVNLTCVVLSAVPTEIIWTIPTSEGKKNLTNSEGRVMLASMNSSSNVILHIKSANLTLDRGEYMCFAKSEYGWSPTNTTFMVRIRGKYAALWPFLGICVEVIILCTIIFIYEKKRDKTEMEESDTDQGPETKSSPDHGPDGVRYRK